MKPKVMIDNIREYFAPPYKFDGLFMLAVYNKRGKVASAFAKFVESAVNEKWERDFGEPRRWILKVEHHTRCAETRCPECGSEFCQCGHGMKFFEHCPSCGTRLLPPEEKTK